MLLNYHICRFVLVSLCVGDLVWLGWGGIRVAGFSLQHGCYLSFFLLRNASSIPGHFLWDL